MIKAVIFDCFGVIYVDSGIDWQVLDYAKLLKKNYKTGMLSNVGRDFLDRIFDDEHPKDQYFDELFASGEIGVSKPDAKAYLVACDRLGVVPAETVFIDDNSGHCQGAERVGMKAIVYRNFDQMKTELEGFLAHSKL